MTVRDDVARTVAEKLSQPKGLVEDIAKIQFEFITHIMEQGDYKAVRIPHGGVWRVKPVRLRHLSKRKGFKMTNVKDDDGKETDNGCD